MSHSETRRKNNWKAVTQQKSIQPCEKDSSPYLVCHFPKQRLMLCLCFFSCSSFEVLYALFNWLFHKHLHDFLSALDTMWHSMMSVSKQFLQVCQIPKESEGVRGKLCKNMLIWDGMTLKWNWKMDTKLYWCCIWINQAKWENLITMENHCSTVEPLTNDHPHQRPSLSYDHISCDGLCILCVYESLTSDHPSYTTTPMWFWGWSYKRGSTVLCFLFKIKGWPCYTIIMRHIITTVYKHRQSNYCTQSIITVSDESTV